MNKIILFFKLSDVFGGFRGHNYNKTRLFSFNHFILRKNFKFEKRNSFKMKATILIIIFCAPFCLLSQTANTSYGTGALTSISSGSYNSGFGENALNLNTTGKRNTAIGAGTLKFNTTGSANTAIGRNALQNNIDGNSNTANGMEALQFNTTGDRNTAIGYKAGDIITTGNYNTVLGHNSDPGSAEASNQTVIGFEALGQADNSVVLGNADVTAVYMAQDADAVIYAGGLGTDTDTDLVQLADGTFTVNGDITVASDARLKSNIVSLGATLTKLLLIDGKSYTTNDSGEVAIGVLAQDIKKVFPELVKERKDGMLSVNYQGLIPVLVNALKEQEKRYQLKFEQQEQRLARLEALLLK